MATTSAIELPIKADASHVISVIDVIVKHLTALREELAALGDDGEPEPVIKHMLGELTGEQFAEFKERFEGFPKTRSQVTA